MPDRLPAAIVVTLSLALCAPYAHAAGPPGASSCAARVEWVSVARTALDNYNLQVRMVCSSSGGDCTWWLRTPDSTAKTFHRGTMHCPAGGSGTPVWAAVDLGPSSAYPGASATREFVGMWAGEPISGTW